jgi:hypothetical protein
MSKQIFISHATKDKEIADAFVDVILHNGLSVSINEIFCVSTDGTKIKSGEDWRKSIQENVLGAMVNFLLISPNYKESEVCMNEMGAAWMTDAIVIPLIIDPINYKTVGVIHEPTQIEKLLDEKSLDRIKDIIQDTLAIPPALIRSDRWTAKKNEFLIRVKKHVEKNPFEIPIDRTAFKELLQEKSSLEKTIEGLIDEKKELERLVENLKKAKDKSEVTAIIKNHKPSTEFQEFQEICKAVKKLLIKQPSIINGIIFKSYTGKEVQIIADINRPQLDEALANGYIDEELDVRWENTKEMREIEKALNKVRKYIKGDLKSEFHEVYEEDYNSPLDINNKKFWEEAFEIELSFK